MQTNAWLYELYIITRGCRGLHRMVVGFTTTYAISAYHHWSCCEFESFDQCEVYNTTQGRIQDFKLGRAQLKKLRRAEGGAKILGVFRVKIHDFTPKKRITESPFYP
jgi:hypothetical protein